MATDNSSSADGSSVSNPISHCNLTADVHHFKLPSNVEEEEYNCSLNKSDANSEQCEESSDASDIELGNRLQNHFNILKRTHNDSQGCSSSFSKMLRENSTMHSTCSSQRRQDLLIGSHALDVGELNQSMSRSFLCEENAMEESFFKDKKLEDRITSHLEVALKNQPQSIEPSVGQGNTSVLEDGGDSLQSRVQFHLNHLLVHNDGSLINNETISDEECNTGQQNLDCTGNSASNNVRDILQDGHSNNGLCSISTPVKGSNCLSFNKFPFSPIMNFNGGSYSTSSCSTETSDLDANSSVFCDSDEANSSASSTSVSLSILQSPNHSNLLDQSNLVNLSTEQEPKQTKFTKALELAKLYNTVKIFDGHCYNVNEGILKVIDLFVKNKESKSGLQRILKTLCNMLPTDHNMPTSAKVVLNFVEAFAPNVTPCSHFYCRKCLMYYDSKTNFCTVCDQETEFGEFFYFDIACIITFFFESRNLAAIMDAHSLHSGAHVDIRDIQDGSVYLSVNAHRNRYDVTLKLATDGLRVRKGSNKEGWLLMITPVEVPPHLSESFTTVVGVWYDELKPRGNTFLKPFCDKLASVEETGGVAWIHPESEIQHNSAVRAPLVIADAPARAMCQNLMCHNGKNGCNICEVKTKKCARVPGKKRIRIYRYVEDPPLRTKDRMLNQAQQATDEEREIKGVKGPSVLALIPSLDISNCVIPEYLHCVLLGVTKQMVTSWMTKPGPWSVKACELQINDRLSNIKHPDFVHRAKRSMKYFKKWKGSDFYYFLLFESLPVLFGVLPERYHQHLMLLVMSIFTLLQRGISENDLVEADLLLKLFVNQYSDLYTDREMTYNVHNLLHLTLCVRRFGPLSCNSAFPFESLNGTIAKASHATNYVAKEIINNMKIYQGAVVLKNILKGTDCSAAEETIPPTKLLGKEKKVELHDKERELVHNLEGIRFFSKAQIGHDCFTSQTHKVLSTENFYVMFGEKGSESYGTIRFFAECDNEIYICIKILKVEHVSVFYHSETLKCVKHIIPINDSDDYMLSKISMLINLTKVGRVNKFIFKRPNLLRQVM